MTVTIDLTPTESAQLIEAARQEGMEPKAFLKKLVSSHLTQAAQLTFAEILTPVHEYSRRQGYSEEEIGEFVDKEIDSYRYERRNSVKARTGE